MSLLIISGISGSGKSVTLDALEDQGYYCIDNLPPQLLLPMCRLQGDLNEKNIAVVVDSRSQEMFRTFNSELDTLEKDGYPFTLIFLYADQDVVLNRYQTTRRRHPLMTGSMTVQQAIEKEFQLCESIRRRADEVIDTTQLTPVQLKNVVVDRFKLTGYEGMSVKLESFGYRNGIPSDADLVFDVRCVPNPYYVPQLKNHSGLDDPVYDYVFQFPDSRRLAGDIAGFLTTYLPKYQEEGKSELVVGIGCTSGHHRSVCFVRYLADALKDLNYRIVVVHRDIDKEF